MCTSKILIATLISRLRECFSPQPEVPPSLRDVIWRRPVSLLDNKASVVFSFILSLPLFLHFFNTPRLNCLCYYIDLVPNPHFNHCSILLYVFSPSRTLLKRVSLSSFHLSVHPGVTPFSFSLSLSLSLSLPQCSFSNFLLLCVCYIPFSRHHPNHTCCNGFSIAFQCHTTPLGLFFLRFIDSHFLVVHGCKKRNEKK